MHLSRIADSGDVNIDPNGTCILFCALLVLLAWLMQFYELLPFFHLIFHVCAARFAALVFISLSSFPFPSFSPTDKETAEYIYDNLPAVDVPSSWLTQARSTVVATIQEELKALYNTGKTYEERVAAILAKLPSPTANFEDLPP